MNFTWSFSALKEYVNCPKQYQELKVLKRYEKKATEQMLYGTVVHKACEDYVAEGKPLEKNYQRFKPVLDSLVAIPGTKYPEHEMALTADKQPCGFRDDGRWVRGIVDLLIVDGDYAFIVDYKTGSNRYPDPKQLKLMALMTFAHFPEVNKIKAGLLFVMHESFMDEEYTRDQIPMLWKYFESDLERLNYSYENDVWQANPTPLCGWCPVKSCEFHKER
jgi:CRISPR/Cas system-associated exonuclease Cas4 (RecB family)